MRTFRRPPVLPPRACNKMTHCVSSSSLSALLAFAYKLHRSLHFLKFSHRLHVFHNLRSAVLTPFKILYYLLRQSYSTHVCRLKCVAIFMVSNHNTCINQMSWYQVHDKMDMFMTQTFKFIFSKTNRKILRVQHTLVAYQVLIDIMQFVLLIEYMLRRVVQRSEHRRF